MSHLGEFLIANPNLARIGCGILLVIGSYLIFRRLREIEIEDRKNERKLARKYRIKSEEA